MENEKKAEVVEEGKEAKKQRGRSWLLEELLILVLSILLGIGAIFVGSWLMNNSSSNPYFHYWRYGFGILLIVVGVAFTLFSITSFAISRDINGSLGESQDKDNT
jgi:polyferredoxin